MSDTGDHGATTRKLPAIVSSASAFCERDYDYLIVGGGTAGLVLAGRLSENPAVSVGVLDAGENKLGDPLVDTPGLFMRMLGNPEYDWMFKTTPQVLGGSSGINYMMYVRGSERDYDDWAVLTDDPSWRFENMRQYITKHQTLEPIPDTITNRVAMSTVGANHGTSGPIHTSFNDTRLDVEDAFIVGADQAAGLTKKPVDAWSGDHYGFNNGLGSVYRTGPLTGKRSYAARGYLEANGHRPNLRVLCSALVTGILLDDEAVEGGNGQHQAVGAAFLHAGVRHEVRARREVLVCAGAIQSPQLLELSGIGDPAVLRRAGVEPKVELSSVGENFQDHVMAGVSYELAAGEVSSDSLWNSDIMARAQTALAEHSAGPLTAVASGQGFVSYKQLATKDELDATIASIRETQKASSEFQRRQLDCVIDHLLDDRSANMQYIFIPASATTTSESIENQATLWLPADPEKPRVMWICGLQYPVSRGSVHISSSDPTVAPAINPSYLTHAADRAVLATGMRFADRIARSPALGPKIGQRTFPAADVDMEAEPEAALGWTLGEYHAAGGCVMGDTLDSTLKVKGVGRLRVVDASVFPNHVSGNCQSSVYALAERAADLIKRDHDA